MYAVTVVQPGGGVVEFGLFDVVPGETAAREGGGGGGGFGNGGGVGGGWFVGEEGFRVDVRVCCFC